MTEPAAKPAVPSGANSVVGKPDSTGIYRHGFGLKGAVSDEISSDYRCDTVDYLRASDFLVKFDDKLELYQEIPSDTVPFEQRPWMKAAEITDELIKQIQSGKHRTLRVNYANGDMVGHTGSFQSAVIAIEALDIALARLLPVIDAAKGVALITADHGNADEMYELDKKGNPVSDGHGGYKAKTSHTLNPVPTIVVGADRWALEGLRDLTGLASLIEDYLLAG